MRKVIRSTKGRGQAAYIATHIITNDLHDEMWILRDKTVALYLASLQVGANGSSVDKKLIEELTGAIDGFNESYQNFSFVYLNVTQGSKQVGLAIRNYFNHQARTFVESLLDQPLSEKTRASITSAHRGTLRDFLNTLCLLADRCRSHGPRDE